MHDDLSLPLGRTILLPIDMQEEHRIDARYLVEGYDRVLANAPDAREGFFAVPKVVE